MSRTISSPTGYGNDARDRIVAANELAMIAMSDDGCPHDLPYQEDKGEKESRFLVTLEEFLKRRGIKI